MCMLCIGLLNCFCWYILQYNAVETHVIGFILLLLNVNIVVSVYLTYSCFVLLSTFPDRSLWWLGLVPFSAPNKCHSKRRFEESLDFRLDEFPTCKRIPNKVRLRISLCHDPLCLLCICPPFNAPGIWIYPYVYRSAFFVGKGFVGLDGTGSGSCILVGSDHWTSHQCAI